MATNAQSDILPFEVTELATALISVGGTLLVFFLGYWLKGREAQEAERTRFHNERRILYAAFMGAAYDETQTKFSAWVAVREFQEAGGREDAPVTTLRKLTETMQNWTDATARLANLQRQLRLIAGREVVRAVASVDPSVFEVPRRSDIEARSGDTPSRAAASIWRDYDFLAELSRRWELERAIVSAARREFNIEAAEQPLDQRPP